MSAALSRGCLLGAGVNLLLWDLGLDGSDCLVWAGYWMATAFALAIGGHA